MGSPWYEIMLGMSYYIHAGGLGALKALPGSVSKRVTPVAVIVLLKRGGMGDLERLYTAESQINYKECRMYGFTSQ